MSPLGFAIVGCGDVSKKHVQAISQVPGCELVAACDKDEEALERFLKKNPVKGYLEYCRLLSNPEVDVVDICTPSALHCSQVIMAALAEKHVLVEKPAALSLKEIDLEIAAAGATGVTLGVVHQNRFNKPVEKLYRAVKEGHFGRLTHASATIRRNRNADYYNKKPWRKLRNAGGGVLANQAIHNIDLLQWIMGPAEEVFAYTGTYFNSMDGEEIGTAVIRFASGALGMVEAASTVFPKNLGDTLSVFGEKGTVVLGGSNVNEVVKWEFKDNSEISALPPNGSGTHIDVITDMVEAINKGKKTRVSGEEARKSLELLLAIYKSSDTGRPVKLPLRS